MVRRASVVCTQVRDREADIDATIVPLEDMYGLLARYEVRLPKEETDLVSDLRYSWKKVCATSVINSIIQRLNIVIDYEEPLHPFSTVISKATLWITTEVL